MNRKRFIKLSTLSITGSFLSSKTISAKQLFQFSNTGHKMPVLFLGHGNPMNALLDNKYTQGWEQVAKTIPTPNAILCVSAHWETKGTKITAMENPRMIYDMYGFPKELYEVQYAAPGSPNIAKTVEQTVKKFKIIPDIDWGLDHGTWSVLIKMFPEATIPCLQLSLDVKRDMQYHYDLAKELLPLRQKGVLIIGSGNIVHNLAYARFNTAKPHDWAIEFDETSKQLINSGNHKSLIEYSKLGNAAELSINSAEHYLPLLYVLGLQQGNEEITQFNEGIEFGAGSMRCVKIG